MKTNDPAFPFRAILAIALGGLTGALVMMAAIRLPNLLISGLFGTFGRPGAPDNWQDALVSTAGSILGGMIFSPWGWIGALAGAAIAWRKLKAVSCTSATSITNASPLAPTSTPSSGEFQIGAGMALMLFSVGIFPSVMVWLLAFFTLPPAIILLFGGLIRSRKPGPGGLAIAKSLVEFTVAFAALLIAALGGTFASCRLLIPAATSPGVNGLWWLIAGMSWIVATLLTRRGFSQWTNISDRRKLLWCVAIACFPVAAFLLHFTLASTGLLPLTA